jgi:hypothetical protein
MLVTRLARPSLVVARARPTERMIRPNRHFWAAKTCSIATRTRARLALPAGHVRRHRLGTRLRSLELRHQPAPRQQCCVGHRAVGGVGPEGARGVPGVEQRAELAAVGGGVGDREGADEAVPAVDAEMVLVSEDRDHEFALGPLVPPAPLRRSLAAPLEGPAAVGVHLRPFRLGRCAWMMVASTI